MSLLFLINTKPAIAYNCITIFSVHRFFFLHLRSSCNAHKIAFTLTVESNVIVFIEFVFSRDIIDIDSRVRIVCLSRSKCFAEP